MATSASRIAYRPQTVNDIIDRTFPISLHLGAMATFFAVVVGMTLGVLAAVNQNGWLDYMSVTLAVLFYSLPNFVMGFLLILLFAVWLPDMGLDLGFRVGGWERRRTGSCRRSRWRGAAGDARPIHALEHDRGDPLRLRAHGAREGADRARASSRSTS